MVLSGCEFMAAHVPIFAPPVPERALKKWCEDNEIHLSN